MPQISFDKHFEDLFENTSDLVHFLNSEGEIDLANPAWLNTLGYQLSEVTGKSIYNFLSPPCIGEYKTARKKVVDLKTRVELTTTFITKDQREIVGEGQIGISFSGNQESYTRGVFKNISAKKVAEKKATESEKRLQTFFRSGPDAVIVIDERQQILEWNPKAEMIFGYCEEEVTGKLLSDTIIPHQYRAAHTRGMQRFLKTGEGPVLNKTIEITALHKDGHEFYINLSISGVKLEGEWLFIAFLSDITERKKTEEALIRKEAELLQSKLLEEKKDEFISIASHELKTPLTTIKAYAQLALSLIEPGEAEMLRLSLAKIDQYTAKLNVLIADLLDVSRIHAGKLSLLFTEVEMHLLLPEVLASMQRITHVHKINLHENAAARVRIDALRMEQVITNIISNAAKYSPGQTEIIVNSIRAENDIIVSFRDFGIGIPAEKLGEIFGRFYRVDEGMKEFSGMGIGLYIAAEIVKQHGGKIWAESSDEGSIFYFSLPVTG